MKSNRINRLIIVIMLITLITSFAAGVKTIAADNNFVMDDQCLCSSPADCLQSKQTQSACAECTSSPDSGKCGCNISSAPDSDEIPAVMPVTSRYLDIDVHIAALPFQSEFEEQPRLMWMVTPGYFVYDSHYPSSAGGRAPPF